MNIVKAEIVALLAVVSLWPAIAVSAGMFGAPVEWGGDVGYSLRLLRGDNSGDATSNQLRGSVTGKTWLWEPWLATVNLGLRGTWDDTQYDRPGLSSSNYASIITGDLDLGILPRSKTPFQLTYRHSDSRVDIIHVDNPLTTLGGQEFSTSRLSMKQSYFTDSGHRFQLRYDNNQRDSNLDSYNDWLFGGEMSLRLPRQSVQAKASYQESDTSVLNQKTKTSLLNIDHFYYPTRDLRIDSMFSTFNTERTSDQPLYSTNKADSTTDLGQISSFVFWRPENRQLSISGGVRLYGLDSTSTGTSVGSPSTTNTVKVDNLSATAGLLYQYTKNLRFDANADYSVNNTEDQDVTSTKQRGGALYQSDLYNVFSGFTYQWYASLSLFQRESDFDSNDGNTVGLGHDIQRVWLNDKFTSWRVSASQAWTRSAQTTNDVDTETDQLTHSASIAWDQHNDSASSMIQLTLSDARQSGDSENNQQFANFQALRTQYLDRLSSLSGNLTIQTVRQDFNRLGNSDTVTTATGQINYRHSRIMGVPNLAFLSDLRVSRAATDEGVDRSEWENRLDYAIGLLNTRLSWRLTDLNGDQFSLLYFQVTRQF